MLLGGARLEILRRRRCPPGRARGRGSPTRNSRKNSIFGFDQPTSVVPSLNVLQPDILRQRSKQGNPLTDQNRHARDNQPLNHALAQKPLNRDSTIDINVANAPAFKFRNDFPRRSLHLLSSSSRNRRQIQFLSA